MYYLFISRFHYTKDKKLKKVDFIRVDNQPVNYDSEKGFGMQTTLKVEEAKDMLEYTVPVMMPMLQEELEWMAEKLPGEKGHKQTPYEGKDVICNLEKGK